MGILISRFRKKKSTIEVLENLEQLPEVPEYTKMQFHMMTFLDFLGKIAWDIVKLEGSRLKTQQRQKRLIATLILYSILSYIAAAVVFYFYYFPEKWKERFLYSLPLLVFPLVIWGVKRILHWYFVKRITGNDMALQDLRDKKQKILEEVMEKETYKKAKEILEKYDPARFKEIETPKPKSPVKGQPGTELRQRSVQQRSPPSSQIRPGMTPHLPVRAQHPGSIRPGVTPYGPRPGSQGMQPRTLMVTPQVNGFGSAQGPPLPRPILPRERGVVDRLLEYLVGDGPQNRYALICRNCYSHNGMALKEEFEYIDFRCCYCYAVNPAKKKRPFAPRIEPPLKPLILPPHSGESQDENEADNEEDESSEEEDEESDEEDDNRQEVSMETDGSHDSKVDTQNQGIPNVKEEIRDIPNGKEEDRDVPNDR